MRCQEALQLPALVYTALIVDQSNLLQTQSTLSTLNATLAHLFLLLQCRLSDRLGSHSQLHKQKALSRLVNTLLTCKLESKQLEPQHNVLSLVYWLARRPLDSAYIPAEAEDDVSGQLSLLDPAATLCFTVISTNDYCRASIRCAVVTLPLFWKVFAMS